MSEDINLAALWIPVMAETSHIKDQLKKAGEEGKKSFLEGLGLSEVGGKMGEGLLDGLKHSELSGGMASILAGGFAGVVAAFTEGGLNLINTAFEKTIDLAKEAAEAVLEIGESWHEVGRQIELSTTASGQRLEELNRSAQNVVRSGLDTSMKNLGSTMGVLSQRIGMTGAPLENLTKDLLRVQDRFGQFKTGDFAAILKEFDVAPADATKTLEQLVNASRATSVSLPELIAGAKTTGSVFHQLGLDAGEAGALVAQLTAAGINTAPVLKALQATAKKLPPGESMADELKAIIEQLEKAKNAGDVPTEQRLAAKLFGPKWADALDAIQKGLLDTSTLIATFSNDGGQSLDQLLEHTATLGNKWTELKNDASAALEPLGETAIKILEGPLEEFKAWFETNHDQIVGKIKDFGDKFIDALPQIRDFVAGAIDLMGPFANALKELGTMVAGTVEPLIEGWALLTGNDKLLKDTQQMGEEWNKIEKLDLSKVFTEASDAVKNMNIDTAALRALLQGAADAANQMDSALGSAAGHGGLGGTGEPGSTYTGSNGQTYQVAPQALSIPMPGSVSGTSPSGRPIFTGAHTADTHGALVPNVANAEAVIKQMFPGVSINNDWRPEDGYNEHSSGEAIDFSINPGGKMGVETPQGQAQGRALKDFLIAHAKDLGLQYALFDQAQWNPNGSSSPMENRGGATDNHLDHVHARFLPGPAATPIDGATGSLGSALSAGLASTGSSNIPQGAGVDQIQQAVIAAAKARGIPDNQIPGILAVAQAESNFGQTGFMGFSTKTADTGYTGGAAYANNYDTALNKFLDNYQAGGLAAQGGPQAKQAAIDALNKGDSGPFLHWLQYGVQGAVPGAGGMNYEYAGNLQKFYGQWNAKVGMPSIIPGSAGQGFLGLGGPKIDFGPNFPVPGQPDPGTPSTLPDVVDQSRQSDITNLMLPPTATAPQSGPVGPLANLPAPVTPSWGGGRPLASSGSWGSTPADGRAPSGYDSAAAADPGSPVSMPAPNIPIPTLTGNYEIDSRNLQLVNQQIEIVRKQESIDQQLAKIADMQNDPTTDPKKLQDAQQKVGLDQQSLAVDKEKLQMDQNKPAKGGSSSKETDAQEFGSGFLKGIFSDLGFGNVLGGKSPLDWGITKLLGGLAGWGIGEANQVADNSMAGQGSTMGGPLGGGSPVGGGIFSGLLQAATGLKIPNAGGVPLGPSGVANSAVDPNSTAHGMANGAQPGPNVYDNRIIVQGNTMSDPHQMAAPITEIQNANTATRASTGSLPITTGPGGG